MTQYSQIRFIESNEGYLDLYDNIEAPINFSVAEIRDISKRNGTFSKTITVPGTGNNNSILNYYFDVNIEDGTFNVKKLQKCQIIQNGIIILDNAYIQLMAVRKRQNVQTNDDIIEYDVYIKDIVGNFFTQLGAKELTDLSPNQFLEYSYELNAQSIVDSFSNDWTNGIKYWLPYTNLPSYPMQDLVPATYVRVLWDKIHESNGFSYDFPQMDDTFIQFNNLLITDNKNKQEVVSFINETHEVITAINAEGSSSINVLYVLNAANTYFDEAFNLSLYLNNQIKDNFNAIETFLATDPLIPYPGALSSPGVTTIPSPAQNGITVWTSPYNIFTSSTNISLTANIKLSILNDNAQTVYAVTMNSAVPKLNINFVLTNQTTNTVYRKNVRSINFFQLPSLPAGFDTTISIGNSTCYYELPSTEIGDEFTFSIELDFNIPRENPVQNSYVEFRTGPTIGSGVLKNVQFKALVYDAKLDIAVNSLMKDMVINPYSYVPKKVKQADFIKSIANMFNLYCIPDKNNPNNVIWMTRDRFYDIGKNVDWTKKLAKDQDQEILFLQDVNDKTLTMTYKADKDSANESYSNATKEIYGQQKVIFGSEWVKTDKTTEIIFSPTPMQPSAWGGITPLLDAVNGESNVRIFLNSETISDNNPYAGFLPYRIYENVVESLLVFEYPLFSHTNSPWGGNFDINFGVCDYYFFPGFQPTTNNLYNLHWRRTMAQIDNSRMMTAMFNLNEYDIQNLELNDKIKIGNAYWNINRIIDYNANKPGLTKVELLSIDEDLDLNTTIVNFGVNKKVDETAKLALVNNERIRKNLLKSSINTDQFVMATDTENVFDSEYTGIAVARKQFISDSGVTVGETTLTSTDGIVTPGYLINDGGLDAV
jgi:hypothetical protein